MTTSRPAPRGRAAQRPSVTRGPNQLWLSSAVAVEAGADLPCPSFATATEGAQP